MSFSHSASLFATAPLSKAGIVEFLAEDNNFGDTRSGSLAGPTGLVIILLLAIGTVLLIRNMNSRLKRLPESFDRPAPGSPTDPPSDPPSDSAPAHRPGETEQQ